MKEKEFLVPRTGLIVRDPRSKAALAEAGEWKPLIGPAGRYWRRRIKCGDVSVGSPVVPSVNYKSVGKRGEDE